MKALVLKSKSKLRRNQRKIDQYRKAMKVLDKSKVDVGFFPITR